MLKLPMLFRVIILPLRAPEPVIDDLLRASTRARTRSWYYRRSTLVS